LPRSASSAEGGVSICPRCNSERDIDAMPSIPFSFQTSQFCEVTTESPQAQLVEMRIINLPHFL